ncbi:STAS domain-containing protein [Saccharothrix syringae]|uniref:Anti-sigma factor antagonist n=1 Tax=Saccharothrix syringae TaxID=103733 RepID=A0A5Q0H643_SACSY|nr:STAS domain-containing protein [Saccharothrix syringae]QFZ21691.1 STAS domain-containing protein [Saccharothrix syringae]
MSFEAKSHVWDGIATIRLRGELEAKAAGRLNRVIEDVSAHPLHRMVLLMDQLSYLSSAGLRSLVYAHQRLGRGVEIVLVGTRPEVAETIRLTGFDRSVVMQEPTGA